MRVAILGANGQIGRILFEAIAKQFPKSEILACVRKKNLHFEGVAGNQLQRSFVFDPCENDWEELGKINVLINCIGIINENKNTFEQAHILPALKILDNRKKIGNPQLIQISALGASSDSVSRFMQTKSFADNMFFEQENAFVVRPSIVCTHNTMLVKSIFHLQKMSRFTFGKIPVPKKFLQTNIQPVHPNDVAEVICKIIAGEIAERKINLPGPEKFSVSELFHLAQLSPIEIPQKISDGCWKILKKIFRNLLSDDQYQLLKQDNTSEFSIAEKIIGKKLTGTKKFWEEELSMEKRNGKKKFQPAFF